MPKNSTLNLGTGAFVALGFAALFFLTTQTTSHGLAFGSPPHYDLTAKFDNIGDLRVGSPVSMSGVEIGRVVKIDFDTREYKAVVTMRVNEKYNQIPTDSDASIYTQGLLGGKFIGLTAGGAETYLKNGDHIDFTQSAFVLENLIGQLLANFAKSSDPRRLRCRTRPPPTAPPDRRRPNEDIRIADHAQPCSWAVSRAARPSPRATVAAPASAGGGAGLRRRTGARSLQEHGGRIRPSACWRSWTPTARCIPRTPQKLDSLVANVLLPNFDSDYAARLVLGQTWRTATPDQRKRFVDAFYHSLLRITALRCSISRRTVSWCCPTRRSRRHPGDGPHRGQEVRRRPGPGEFSLHKTDRDGRPGTW